MASNAFRNNMQNAKIYDWTLWCNTIFNKRHLISSYIIIHLTMITVSRDSCEIRNRNYWLVPLSHFSFWSESLNCVRVTRCAYLIRGECHETTAQVYLSQYNPWTTRSHCTDRIAAQSCIRVSSYPFSRKKKFETVPSAGQISVNSIIIVRKIYMVIIAHLYLTNCDEIR